MQTTLHLVGKWAGRLPVVALAAGHNSGFLFVCDTVSKWQFLPATGLDRCTRQTGPPLVAANSNSIRMYGTAHFPFNSPPTHISGSLSSLRCHAKSKRLVDAATYHSFPLSSTDQYVLMLKVSQTSQHPTSTNHTAWYRALHHHQGTTCLCLHPSLTSRQVSSS